MEWAVDRATGPIIFQSTPHTPTQGFSSPDTFNTGGLVLVEGRTYVAFVDAGDVYNPNDHFGVGIISGGNNPNPYLGGKYFLFSWQADTLAELSTVPWDREGNVENSDAAFIARFSDEPIPEPSTFALLIAAGCALLGYGWRRKRKAAR